MINYHACGQPLLVLFSLLSSSLCSAYTVKMNSRFGYSATFVSDSKLLVSETSEGNLIAHSDLPIEVYINGEFYERITKAYVGFGSFSVGDAIDGTYVFLGDKMDVSRHRKMKVKERSLILDHLGLSEPQGEVRAEGLMVLAQGGKLETDTIDWDHERDSPIVSTEILTSKLNEVIIIGHYGSTISVGGVVYPFEDILLRGEFLPSTDNPGCDAMTEADKTEHKTRTAARHARIKERMRAIVVEVDALERKRTEATN